MRIAEGNPLAEELLHYILSEFLGKPEVHAIIRSGGGFFYCLRMATNSWKSTTSPFYRTYRDPNLQHQLPESMVDEPEENHEDPGKEELHQKIKEVVEDLGWYEKELLKLYAEHNGNASAVSRLTKIPRTSINLTIRKVKQHVHKSVK